MGHLSEDTPEVLAARYSTWGTAELVRAVDLEADGYRPEALELMRQELDRRGAGVQIRTSAREAEVENDRRHYVGVGGWLVVFMVFMALGSIQKLTQASFTLLAPLTSLPLPLRALSALDGLVGLYGMVIIGLLMARYRAAPQHAKIFVGTSWLVSVLMPALLIPFFMPLDEWMLVSFILSSIATGIWWTYFSRSKRVRMTFLPESEWYDEPLSQEQALAGIDGFRASDRLSRDEVHDRALR